MLLWLSLVPSSGLFSASFSWWPTQWLINSFVFQTELEAFVFQFSQCFYPNWNQYPVSSPFMCVCVCVLYLAPVPLCPPPQPAHHPPTHTHTLPCFQRSESWSCWCCFRGPTQPDWSVSWLSPPLCGLKPRLKSCVSSSKRSWEIE